MKFRNEVLAVFFLGLSIGDHLRRTKCVSGRVVLLLLENH